MSPTLVLIFDIVSLSVLVTCAVCVGFSFGRDRERNAIIRYRDAHDPKITSLTLLRFVAAISLGRHRGTK